MVQSKSSATSPLGNGELHLLRWRLAGLSSPQRNPAIRLSLQQRRNSSLSVLLSLHPPLSRDHGESSTDVQEVLAHGCRPERNGGAGRPHVVLVFHQGSLGRVGCHHRPELGRQVRVCKGGAFNLTSDNRGARVDCCCRMCQGMGTAVCYFVLFQETEVVAGCNNRRQPGLGA